MKLSVIHIKEMDCPSEEQMIRMRFADSGFIKDMIFDYASRTVQIYHTGDTETVMKAVKEIGFTPVLKNETAMKTAFFPSSQNISSAPVLSNQRPLPHQTEDSGRKKRERSALWLVLIINFSFFIIEALAGYLAFSAGLLADSLDMLADSFVYGISLAAVKASLPFKKRTAFLSGLLQTALAVAGYAEILRRFLYSESVPDPFLMISVSAFALIGNTASLIILQRARSAEVHIKSSMIFTSNDILANAGVIAAGLLTVFTDSLYPDLAVGSAVFAFVLAGAVRILKLSVKT